MSQKPSDKQYPIEVKEEAVNLVLEQGYSVPEVAKSLAIIAWVHERYSLGVECPYLRSTFSANSPKAAMRHWQPHECPVNPCR